MSDPFIGEIRMVAFNYEPNGWAFCNGQLLPINSNAALFSLLGTTFGGDGRTTFGLPDLRGRGPVGANNSSGPGLAAVAYGEKGGAEAVTITTPQMPAHTHQAAVTASGTASLTVGSTISNPTTAPSATNNVLGASASTGAGQAAIWSDALSSPVTLANPEAVNVSVSVTNSIAGGGQPVEIRNPYLGTNFIIALQGIYPSRQ